MATPVLHFNPQTFAQSNPFMQGMQTAAELPNTFAKAIFGPKMAAQDLYKQQLMNREMSAQAQYAPENALAGMQQNQLKVPFTQAQIKHLEETTRLLPEQTRISLMNALAKQAEVEQSKNRFGADYMASKFMATPFGQALTSSNPQLASQLANVIGGNARAAESQYGLGQPQPQAQQMGLPGALNKMSPQQMASPAQVNPAAGVAQFTPEQVSGAQDMLSSKLIKSTTPNALLLQRTYANSADQLLKQVAPELPIITKFAGIQGQTNAKWDDMLARFDIKTDPDFAKYNNFMTVTGPTIANDIKRAMGAAATDTERSIFEHLTVPEWWKNNPELALQQLQTLSNSLYTVEGALNKSTAGTQQTLQEQLNQGPIQIPQMQSKSSGSSGSRVTVYRNGKAVTVPSSQLEDALKIPGVTRGP